MKRRQFIKTNTAGLAAVSILPVELFSLNLNKSQSFISQRPPADKRTFTRAVIEHQIQEIKAQIADKELAWMFENC